MWQASTLSYLNVRKSISNFFNASNQWIWFVLFFYSIIFHRIKILTYKYDVVKPYFFVSKMLWRNIAIRIAGMWTYAKNSALVSMAFNTFFLHWIIIYISCVNQVFVDLQHTVCLSLTCFSNPFSASGINYSSTS